MALRPAASPSRPSARFTALTNPRTKAIPNGTWAQPRFTLPSHGSASVDPWGTAEVTYRTMTAASSVCAARRSRALRPRFRPRRTFSKSSIRPIPPNPTIISRTRATCRVGRAATTVPTIAATSSSSPPTVGVPAFPRCRSGASSRMAWRIFHAASCAITVRPDRSTRRKASVAASAARSMLLPHRIGTQRLHHGLQSHGARPLDQNDVLRVDYRRQDRDRGLPVWHVDDAVGRHDLTRAFRQRCGLRTEGHNYGHSPLRGLPADLPVEADRLRAEFLHVPQHHYAPATTGDRIQNIQRRAYRAGAGVVGIVEDEEVAGLLHLQPPRRRRGLLQAGTHRVERHPQGHPHGRGGQRVGHVVPAGQG